MIFTLAWKELREHQGIWLTMVVMTVVLGAGLAKIVALGDPHIAVPTAAFTIFGMAAAYGVVCGSMMFAGEREGGTLPFLDIFLGAFDIKRLEETGAFTCDDPDRMVFAFELDAVYRATGAPFMSSLIEAWQFRNGKVLKIVAHYLNSPLHPQPAS